MAIQADNDPKGRQGTASSVAASWIQITIHGIASKQTTLSQLHPDDTMGRILIVRAGLPAKAVDVMAENLGVSKMAVCALLGVRPATAARQARAQKTLSSKATERAVFVAGLVKMVENMIPDDFDAKGFDASKWVARWLDTQIPALDGKTPKSYLDTADGREIVERLLGQMESGAYA